MLCKNESDSYPIGCRSSNDRREIRVEDSEKERHGERGFELLLIGHAKTTSLLHDGNSCAV